MTTAGSTRYVPSAAPVRPPGAAHGGAGWWRGPDACSCTPRPSLVLGLLALRWRARGLGPVQAASEARARLPAPRRSVPRAGLGAELAMRGWPPPGARSPAPGLRRPRLAGPRPCLLVHMPAPPRVKPWHAPGYCQAAYCDLDKGVRPVGHSQRASPGTATLAERHLQVTRRPPLASTRRCTGARIRAPHALDLENVCSMGASTAISIWPAAPARAHPPHTHTNTHPHPPTQTHTHKHTPPPPTHTHTEA